MNTFNKDARRSNFLGNDRGFTLVELIMTVVISGVLFFAIGMITIESQVAWERHEKTAGLFEDQIYCRNFIEWQIRTSTGPFTVNQLNQTPRISYYGFYTGTLFLYTTTYRELFLESSRIMYREGKHINTAAEAPPGSITFLKEGGTRLFVQLAYEMVISSVTPFTAQDNKLVSRGFEITKNPNNLGNPKGSAMVQTQTDILKNPNIFFGFNIEQQRTMYNANVPVIKVSSFSFVVSARNLDDSQSLAEIKGE